MPGNDGDEVREFVCANCIEEEHLQEVVRANLSELKCDYCGAESTEPIACHLDYVIEAVGDAIDSYYGDPAVEGAPYDGREGGYQLVTLYSSDEILQDMGFCPDNWVLFEDINSHFCDIERCEKDWILLSPLQRKKYGWELFKDVVTHRRRFTFWTAKDGSDLEGHPDNLPVANMLPEIADAINCANCFVEVPCDTNIWRVRIHGADIQFNDWSDLCTPPKHSAVYSNRMSPAGVPMFYGAVDFDTAVIETYDPDKDDPPHFATGAAFRPVRPLLLLDLINLPPVPSMFAPNTDALRNAVIFLDDFLQELSRPVKKERREHLEYVPTQVFSEFIRFEYKHARGQGLDGIVYPSSRNDQPCYVIFATHEQCNEVEHEWEDQQMLSFVADSKRTIQLT